MKSLLLILLALIVGSTPTPPQHLPEEGRCIAEAQGGVVPHLRQATDVAHEATAVVLTLPAIPGPASATLLPASPSRSPSPPLQLLPLRRSQGPPSRA